MEQREGLKLIFRRFRRDPRTGAVLDAWKYGIKAWPIWIPDLQLKLPFID